MKIRRKVLPPGTPLNQHEIVEVMWPFHHLSNPQDYEDVPPYEWEDVVTIARPSYDHGNSNGCYVQSTITGRKYWLWEMSMEEIINNAHQWASSAGTIPGVWGFRKMGNHVGIKWIRQFSPLY